jgi:hypothetical protein
MVQPINLPRQKLAYAAMSVHDTRLKTTIKCRRQPKCVPFAMGIAKEPWQSVPFQIKLPVSRDIFLPNWTDQRGEMRVNNESIESS